MNDAWREKKQKTKLFLIGQDLWHGLGFRWFWLNLDLHIQNLDLSYLDLNWLEQWGLKGDLKNCDATATLILLFAVKWKFYKEK